jgi:hypothetical protein
MLHVEIKKIACVCCKKIIELEDSPISVILREHDIRKSNGFGKVFLTQSRVETEKIACKKCGHHHEIEYVLAMVMSIKH